MHIIIIGKNHGNRSRWMKDLSKLLPDPCGFFAESVRDEALGGIRIYLHDLKKPRIYSEANYIGTCINRKTDPIARGYEEMVPAVEAIPAGALVLFDHLGPMDAVCPAFQDAVLKVFDRSTVLAAMPDRDIPYLSAIRERADAQCFYADTDSYAEAADYLRNMLNRCFAL